ncbi:GerAB/ArcD/ProY family transporter [Bacillus tuaregi]|uniref:GerAB/ArcD/ProY family transporter n=1 Tax=Bacillus tuaregi TaxID=1816695 RepID=UPI0008F868F3|nr:endospore germination permease [Bacillus tuaregi]
MLEKGKISIGDFRIMVIIFSIGSSVILAPSILAGTARQDGWLSYFIAIVTGLGFLYIYNLLASLYPELSFVEYSRKILGKWIGSIIAILFLTYIFLVCSTLLREIGEFITINVLVETPIQIIMIMFLITSLIGIRLGIEVIGRTAMIFFPWIIGLFTLLFLFLIPEYELINIQPVFEEGIKPILKGSYHTLALPFLELSIFLMIVPYVVKKDKVKKAFYSGALIGGMIIFFLVLLTFISLGPDTTNRQMYSTYLMGKKISIGDFIERIEIIVAIIWFLSIYFKLTLCYYSLVLGLAQLFKLNSYQILAFPLGILIISFSILQYPNISLFKEALMKTLVPYSLFTCFIIPLLLLTIGKIKKQRSGTVSSSSSSGN